MFPQVVQLVTGHWLIQLFALKINPVKQAEHVPLVEHDEQLPTEQTHANPL